MRDHREIQELLWAADELDQISRVAPDSPCSTLARLPDISNKIRRLADRLEAKLEMARKMFAENP